MNIVGSNVLVRKAIMYVRIRLLQFGSSMLGEIGHFLDKVMIIIMTKELQPHTIIISFGRGVKYAFSLSSSTSILIFRQNCYQKKKTLMSEYIPDLVLSILQKSVCTYAMFTIVSLSPFQDLGTPNFSGSVDDRAQSSDMMVCCVHLLVSLLCCNSAAANN